MPRFRGRRRRMYDYADPRVAGAIGTGQDPTLFAWIGEASRVERRTALVDAVRQVERVRAGRSPVGGDPDPKWRAVDEEDRFRYVNRSGADVPSGRRSAPPLRMRLRCWYEILIETAGRKRVVLREEGLRGDDRRTAARAIDRWRRTHAKNVDELVVVREVRIAKRQPRPLPPDESGPRPVNDGWLQASSGLLGGGGPGARRAIAFLITHEARVNGISSIRGVSKSSSDSHHGLSDSLDSMSYGRVQILEPDFEKSPIRHSRLRGNDGLSRGLSPGFHRP